MYATRDGTDLATITDASGHNGALAGAATLIATAVANTALRGVAMAPRALVTVTPSASPNGTISPATPQSVLLGTTTAFTVVPDPSWSAVVGGTCGGTLVGSTYTTNVLLADCSVSVTFTAIPTYTVTPSADAGGSISPGTPQTVASGGSRQFTVTPSPGYTVSVGGTCGGSLVGGTYTTDAITADCTVDATFTLITHRPSRPARGPTATSAPGAPQAVGYAASAAVHRHARRGLSRGIGRRHLRRDAQWHALHDHRRDGRLHGRRELRPAAALPR